MTARTLDGISTDCIQLADNPAQTGIISPVCPLRSWRTASAFSIVVLGGLGSVTGSLLAAYIVGYLETVTAYLVSPAYRFIPSLLLLLVVMYVRPRGLLGRR